MILLLVLIIIFFVIGCILIYKWHNKKVQEVIDTRDRAIAGGCPFFSSEQ